MSTIAELLALLTPPLCAVCRTGVPANAPPICATCVRALPWLPERRCPACGLPDHGIRACPASRAAFAAAWSPVAYEGVARGLVRALKFDAALPIGGLMAAQIATNAPPWILGGDRSEPAGAVLVPVPTARARTRRRGFDPAAVLAAALVARTGLTVSACLRRRGRAPRQVGASRRDRRAADRVLVDVARNPPPGLAILVDDVHTTGATLDACARALRAAGTQRVHAVAYARTL